MPFSRGRVFLCRELFLVIIVNITTMLRSTSKENVLTFHFYREVSSGPVVYTMILNAFG